MADEEAPVVSHHTTKVTPTCEAYGKLKQEFKDIFVAAVVAQMAKINTDHRPIDEHVKPKKKRRQDDSDEESGEEESEPESDPESESNPESDGEGHLEEQDVEFNFRCNYRSFTEAYLHIPFDDEGSPRNIQQLHALLLKADIDVQLSYCRWSQLRTESHKPTRKIGTPKKGKLWGYQKEIFNIATMQMAQTQIATMLISRTPVRGHSGSKPAGGAAGVGARNQKMSASKELKASKEPKAAKHGKTPSFESPGKSLVGDKPSCLHMTTNTGLFSLLSPQKKRLFSGIDFNAEFNGGFQHRPQATLGYGYGGSNLFNNVRMPPIPEDHSLKFAAGSNAAAAAQAAEAAQDAAATPPLTDASQQALDKLRELGA